MAVLDAAQRAAVLGRFMRQMRQAGLDDIPGQLTKPDLAAAVAGIDALLDASATAINNAIPQPARGALSTRQKAYVVALVAQMRMEVI